MDHSYAHTIAHLVSTNIVEYIMMVYTESGRGGEREGGGSQMCALKGVFAKNEKGVQV